MSIFCSIDLFISIYRELTLPLENVEVLLLELDSTPKLVSLCAVAKDCFALCIKRMNSFGGNLFLVFVVITSLHVSN